MIEKGLIFFMRYPEKGLVKTRLARDLGDTFTLDLYKHFIIDILKTCQLTDAEIMIAYSISEKIKNEKLFLSKQHIHFYQNGHDLGPRMFNALCEAAKRGFKKCILIGSDSPDLPSGIIDEGYNALGEADITLGPSSDGGYYLIGFRSDRINYRIFSRIRWGTPYVLEDTLENIKKTGMRLYLLPEWDDVDDVYDLIRYY